MASKQMHSRARRLYSIFTRKVSSSSHLRNNIGIGGFALLSVPVATFCLGTWQVKRRTWKLNLIEDVKEKNSAPPVDLPYDLEDLSTMEYCRVKLQGEFDHSKEIYIGPRQLVTDDEKGGGLLSERPHSGSNVITPFHLTDRNATILINRGWVPKHLVDPITRPDGQVTGEVEFIGTVRLPEKRPLVCPQNQPGSRQFYYRDVANMSLLTGASPIFIDADSTSTVPGGPIGGQTRIMFRNEHFSYILTWYSLCLVTSFMWYRKYFHGLKALR